MAGYKIPGVYVEEISVFPPSVAEVETAVPAFIGYTQTSPGSLRNKPVKIGSLLEYEVQFGKARNENFSVTLSETAVNGVYPILSLTEPVLAHYLYYSIRMFFENGGRKCYVVSVGDTASAVALGDGASGLLAGLHAVAREDEPTLIVIPDAALLDDGAAGAGYAKLAQAALAQCGAMGDRFAILDVTRAKSACFIPEINAYRELLGTSNLKYGAAYYPYIKTRLNYVFDDTSVTLGQPSSPVSGHLNGLTLANLNDPAHVRYDPVNYRNIRNQLSRLTMTLPPSGAIAGVYAAVDASRGVWKAPANVSLNAVIVPSVNTDSFQQDELNVDATSGKSINAIRFFTGKGTLVWGARTLAGNDNEWRYIPVRRFFNMVEESLKKSTYWVVFEPNDANTWLKVCGMIENYLTQKWRDGALVGTKPEHAFYVSCGLRITMTPQDILEGRLNVEIGMAVVRPAEFIILKFSHKLQAS